MEYLTTGEFLILKKKVEIALDLDPSSPPFHLLSERSVVHYPWQWMTNNVPTDIGPWDCDDG